ncbi:MAG TPA: hypothetical protein DDW29_04010, partial [Gammaproteobacteria bacterium]|nr:hypothetical protein [Gammaproteobacteria bacterium]
DGFASFAGQTKKGPPADDPFLKCSIFTSLCQHGCVYGAFNAQTGMLDCPAGIDRTSCSCWLLIKGT